MFEKTWAPALGLLASILSFGVLAQPHDLDSKRVWVHYAPGQAASVGHSLDNAKARTHHHFPNLRAFAASVPPAALAGLQRNPRVTLIEEDPVRYPLSQTVPYGIDAVQARDVWDADTDGSIDADAPTGAGRLVCVIDSGLYTGHGDFQGVNIVGGYPAGWNTDTCGHGTHVAGTINAANNATGVVGVSPGKASLYIVKVFDGPSCGWSYSSDLVDAAQRCQGEGANIISMSLGGGRSARAEDNAFKSLYNAGILSIAAAGNDGNTRKSYPASYSSVMSVAAVDSNNAVADFSQQNSAVEIAAPGVGVLSTVPWVATNTLNVDGITYSGGRIENAANGEAGGPLVDGGLCDGTGPWSGVIVLCERGVVSFYEKVVNVQNGGGAGAAIFNNEPGNFAGTLGDGNSSAIPAISLSQEDGQTLQASATGQSATLVSTVSAPDSGYEAWDGTSMATPHVSGVAALVWSANPGLSNQAIRDALTATALDLGDPGPDNAYGYGLVQAAAAIGYLGGGGTPVNQPPAASFTHTCQLLACAFDASASSDSDGSIESYDWDFGDGTGTGVTTTGTSHSFAASGVYDVTLTVTDDEGATSSSTRSVAVSDGSGGGAEPVITSVSAAKTKGTSFEITWTTDVPADSEVRFSCCGTFSDSALVTAHSMSFRGTKGVLYQYWVRSTAQGQTAEEGPFEHQN